MDLPGPLVDVGWLLERPRAPGLVVADVRWVPDGTGRSAYKSGHIPGAVYLDVDLSDPPGGGRGRHPLLSPENFARTMSEAGVSDDDAVVAYDDAGGSHAVRLWWMLEVTGHGAAVLDGALSAWPGPRETGSARRPPASFSARPWPAMELAGLGRPRLYVGSWGQWSSDPPACRHGRRAVVLMPLPAGFTRAPGTA